jgi:hypothetical protein
MRGQEWSHTCVICISLISSTKANPCLGERTMRRKTTSPAFKCFVSLRVIYRSLINHRSLSEGYDGITTSDYGPRPSFSSASMRFGNYNNPGKHTHLPPSLPLSRHLAPNVCSYHLCPLIALGIIAASRATKNIHGGLRRSASCPRRPLLVVNEGRGSRPSSRTRSTTNSGYCRF